jgi:ABC-type transporter Mla maintaining outer membrane lipid asymmetry ATPase subunit MlaF
MTNQVGFFTTYMAMRQPCHCGRLPLLLPRATRLSPARLNPPTHAIASAFREESEMQDSDVVIEFKNIHKAFGSKKVLRGATFRIRRGEAVGIIGGSGTGKSTTLRLISGLLQPDQGNIVINGTERVGLLSDGAENSFGLKLGLVFQNAALFDSLTVTQNVGFQLFEHSHLPTEQIEALVKENLAKVGLHGVGDLQPSQLSGGMKKRVALARAITTELDAGLEKIIMYDEPTAGLDPVASTVVENLMRSIHTPDSVSPVGSRSGVSTYIVVTHQHSTIRRAVDRIIFLDEGTVVWEGPTAEFDQSDNPFVSQFSKGLLDGPLQYK